ncbi:hypothetical protein [Tunturibacter empetritectus]|uniref:Uncharacterized protein n=1 Tax=Tunturiibacter empetritectus TaxID=3069691 RepID=A0A7W8IIT0_9BACT|nr:hypothetical protein [Edaphobacter lichenicola]MBB5316928.1 hypothetical protein [Edaphobacter lichenicola]
MCKRETVWLEPQYTLSISVTADKQLPVTKTMTVTRQAYLNDEVQTLITSMNALSGEHKVDANDASACPSSVGAIWDRVAANKSYSPVAALETSGGLGAAEAVGNIVRVGDSAAVVTEVDYKNVYYLNTKSPWIGTAQVNAKLGSDGTLTEASAQVDDETWSTILNAATSLVGDFLGGGSGASAPAAAAAPATSGVATPALVPERVRFSCPALPGWPTPTGSFSYKYSLTTTVYKHDHTELSGLDKPCETTREGVVGGNFTVVAEAMDAQEKKDDSDTISVKGAIKLPKKSSADKAKGTAGKQEQ